MYFPYFYCQEGTTWCLFHNSTVRREPPFVSTVTVLSVGNHLVSLLLTLLSRGPPIVSKFTVTASKDPPGPLPQLYCQKGTSCCLSRTFIVRRKPLGVSFITLLSGGNHLVFIVTLPLQLVKNHHESLP